MAQVLLVEPDFVLARAYGQALTSAGHQVKLAQDAQSAVNAIDAARPDLIILEVQLPAHNGIEFIYELRSHGDWQSIPIILLSQLPLARLNIDKHKLASLGIVGYSYKPQTNLQKLVDMVDERIGAIHE